ncbi:MAG: hypothetical protein GY763_11900, partial [Gammaproteobacteria bacterium]|nr:hypothetical protein [Gammaproteobacteria bacterium]
MFSNCNIVFKALSAGSNSNIWALDRDWNIYYCNGPSDFVPTPIGGYGGYGHKVDYPNGAGGWGFGGGGHGLDYLGGSGGGSCGGRKLKTSAGGGGYSWMNGQYISEEFQMIRKDGRSGGSPRKHPKDGYAKYEISDSDTPFTDTDWVKVDGKLSGISVADDGTVRGVDEYNEIYRRNADDRAWEKVPGVRTEIMSIVQ